MFDFKKFFQLIAFLITTSCVSNLHELAQLENGLKLDNFYSSYLALEYLEYSRSLSNAGNWHDAEYFAKKGLDVSHGYKFTPESPIYWGSAPAEREDAIVAQKRLENVSTHEVQKVLPIQMAHLTFLYDCWISKDSKPAFRAGELSKCKTRFYKLLDEVENYVDDLHKDRLPKTIIIEPDFERFEIMFDLDNFSFNDKANKKLIEVIKYLATLNGNYRVMLVGNADRSGNALYNENLALKRVEMVHEYLMHNGVAKDLIEMRSFGEDFPDIITQKGVQQQSNRVVGIYILKGIGSFSSFPLPLIMNDTYKDEILKARSARGLK